MQPFARHTDTRLDKLIPTIPHDEAVIYCIEPESQRWVRARFGGSRPNGDFLVIFREDESATLPIDKVYVLNKAPDIPINPAHFLASQTNDAPFSSLAVNPLSIRISSSERHVGEWLPFQAAQLNLNLIN